MPPRRNPAEPSGTDRIRELLRLNGYSKAFIAEHIRGLIRIYAIGGIKDAGAVGLMYDILFLDPVTTRHFAQFQGMWKHRRSRRAPYQEWWDTFRLFLRDCFDKTRVQMNRYHDDNPLPDDLDGNLSDEEARTRWFPGTPKMQPPSPPPAKKQKLDHRAIHPFNLYVVEAGDYAGPHDLPLFGPSAKWHFTGVDDVSWDGLWDVIFGLCRRKPGKILGCLVQPTESSGLREHDVAALFSDRTVANFFAVGGYSPLTIVIVLAAQEEGDGSLGEQHSPEVPVTPPSSPGNPVGGEEAREVAGEGAGVPEVAGEGEGVPEVAGEPEGEGVREGEGAPEVAGDSGGLRTRGLVHRYPGSWNSEDSASDIESTTEAPAAPPTPPATLRTAVAVASAGPTTPERGP